MKIVYGFQDWLNEKSSGELFQPKRNQPVQFDPKRHPELADEFFDLIATAYAEIGGHAKVQSPRDVFADPDWDFWEGVDIHGDQNFDIILFGSKTRYGIKYAGVGHDGSKDAKRVYLDARGKELHKSGNYIEVSGKLAAILIGKYGCPVVSDHKDVEKVLGKEVEWLGKNTQEAGMPGDGWYIRKIGGHPHAKIMLGKPKV
jgi:hypothetical protein